MADPHERLRYHVSGAVQRGEAEPIVEQRGEEGSGSQMTGPAPEGTCRHCGRRIVTDAEGRWVDPEATGDDSVWRETCDEHDTFIADHEPDTAQVRAFDRDAIEAAVDWNSHKEFDVLIDGNLLISVKIDEVGEAEVVVYKSTHPEAEIAWTGLVNVAERGEDTDNGT